MKTIVPKQIKGNDRKWYLVDAKGQTLGRLASKIAVILKGKNRVDYAPHVDNGDYVVVVNCADFQVTGNKMEDKMYYRHSGFLGGLKTTNLAKMLETKPQNPLKLAISGMLPKNKLRAPMLERLKLFEGAEHTFAAQQPEVIML